jgi:hypothetical protein
LIHPEGVDACFHNLLKICVLGAICGFICGC